MADLPGRGSQPPDVDVQLLALVVGLVVAAAVTWAAYRDPQFGGAAAVGLAVLVAVLAAVRREAGSDPASAGNVDSGRAAARSARVHAPGAGEGLQGK